MLKNFDKIMHLRFNFDACPCTHTSGLCTWRIKISAHVHYFVTIHLQSKYTVTNLVIIGITQLQIYEYVRSYKSMNMVASTLRDVIQYCRNFLKGVLHPRPVFGLFLHFLKNYKALVTSKICFL